MYIEMYVTRAPKAAFFYKNRTQWSRAAAHRASTNGTQCLVCAFFIGCQVTSSLYAFCHTLEEFSICSMCDFRTLVKKRKK